MAAPTEIHHYSFNGLSTTSAGIRFENDDVGTKDANAYSGQMLGADALNDYVKKASHANMDNFSVEIYGVVGSSSSHAYFFAKRDGATTDYGITRNGSSFDIWLSGGSDTIPDITVSTGDFIHIILSCDVSNNIVVSINKVEKSSFTTKTPARNNAIDTFFFARGDGAGGATLFNNHQLGGYVLYNRVLTTTEKEYRYDNLESAVKMAKGGTDTGTTVVTADIVECIPFTEGTGNSTVTELVSPSTATMYNFPSDDTQWTNADLLQYGLQRLAIQPNGDVAADDTFEADGNIYLESGTLANATYSVLMFINPDAVSGTQQLLDARGSSGAGQIYLSGATLTASSGTAYVNGLAGSTVTAAWQSIGISGITLNATNIRYIEDYLAANNFTGLGGVIAIASGVVSAADMLSWHDVYKSLYIAGGTSYTGSATFDISGSVAATSILSNTGSATLDISGSMVSTSTTDDQATKAIYTTTIEDVPKYEVNIQSVLKYETTTTNTPKYIVEITYGGE